MKCSGCGCENSEHARFCRNCGQKLDARPMETEAVQDFGQEEDLAFSQCIEEDEFLQEGPLQYEMNPKNRSYKRIPLIFGTVVIAVAVAAIWGSGMGQEAVYAMQYRQQLSLGEKYLEAEDYEAAELAYNKAMQIDPYKSDSYVGLADVYLRQGQEEKAEEVIRQAKDHGFAEVEEDVEQLDEKVDVAQDEKNVTSSDAPGSPEIEDKLEEELPVPPVEASEDEKTDASEKEDAEGTPDSESESETDTGSAVKIDWALAPSYDFYDMEPVITNYPGSVRSLDQTAAAWMSVVLTCQEPKTEADQTEPAVETYNFGVKETGEDETEKYGLIDYTGKEIAAQGTVERSASGLPTIGKTNSGDQPIVINPDGSDGQALGTAVYTPSYYILESDQKGEGFDDSCAGAVLAYDKAGDKEPAGVVIFDGKGNRINGELYDYGFQLADGLIVLCKDGKWGAVDITGKTVIPFEYEAASYTHNGATPVCKDGKWGYVDRQGKGMTAFVFEKALPSYQGQAWVKYDGKWGVVRLEGAEEEPETESPATTATPEETVQTEAPLTEAPQTETPQTETEAPQTESQTESLQPSTEETQQTETETIGSDSAVIQILPGSMETTGPSLLENFEN